MTLPGYPLHVVQRGHNRQNCFNNDPERSLYLGLIVEHAQRSRCRVHAYVLMSNHVHMLLTSEDESGLSDFMKRVHQTYAQYMNRKYGRVGTLWQGRFYSSLVDTDSYFLACQRYIELNPVRAGMVPHPDMHPWSSFSFNAVGGQSFISPHNTYLALGREEESRRRAYRMLFDSAPMTGQLESRIRDAIRGCLPLGSDAFLARIAAAKGRPMERRRPGPKSQPMPLPGQLTLVS